jgi:hypothetical protein
MIDTINDITSIDDDLDAIFDESLSGVKTEKSIITYDKESNKLQSELSEYTLRMCRDTIDDDKELNKFIKKCESIIRMSPEYSDWTDYIRNVMEMTECQITGEMHIQAKSDIHHHPICLYTLVKGAILKRIVNEKEFSSIDIAKEVLEMHYEMKAPFVVLLKSLHEKYHAGYLQLPMELVQGDYKYFMDTYSHFLETDDIDPVLTRLKVNWTNCGYDKNRYSWRKDELPEVGM